MQVEKFLLRPGKQIDNICFRKQKENGEIVICAICIIFCLFIHFSVPDPYP
jgi:hypothetical protein